MWPEREKITQATWTSPVTNRMLFEAGFSSFSSKWGGYAPPGSQTGLVAVTEQSTAAGVPVPNFTYRGWSRPRRTISSTTSGGRRWPT